MAVEKNIYENVMLRLDQITGFESALEQWKTLSNENRTKEGEMFGLAVSIGQDQVVGLRTLKDPVLVIVEDANPRGGEVWMGVVPGGLEVVSKKLKTSCDTALIVYLAANARVLSLWHQELMGTVSFHASKGTNRIGWGWEQWNELLFRVFNTDREVMSLHREEVSQKD